MEQSLVAKDLNPSNLDYLTKLAKEVNPQNLRIPILKINYDAKSKVAKPGEWVVGQTKDNTGKNIQEEGKKVTHFIILQVRNKFSLYNQKDFKQNCDSIIFKDFEKVKGDKWGYNCGKDCPYRAKDVTPGCSFQKVVFGMAITEGGEKIECVMYLHGKSFMPFVEYYKTLPEVTLPDGKKINLPYFAFINKLGSTQDSSGSITYYVANFNKVEIIQDQSTITKLKEKADKIVELINGLNEIGTKAPQNVEEVNDQPTNFAAQTPQIKEGVVIKEGDVQSHVTNLFDE